MTAMDPEGPSGPIRATDAEALARARVLPPADAHPPPPAEAPVGRDGGRWPRLRALAGRHPRLAVLGATLLMLGAVPVVDLTTAGLVYDPSLGGFPDKGDQPWRFFLRGAPWLVYGLVLYLGLLWLADRLWHLPVPGLGGRQMGYLVLSLALGPGLLVNGLFKSHWGRARPNEITFFGGEARYTPPFMIADQCTGNCSFPSGHAAIAFWTVALAWIAPPLWRPWAMAGALTFGVVVGASRIGLGAHFVSDTLASALLVIGLNALLLRGLGLAGRSGPGRDQSGAGASQPDA